MSKVAPKEESPIEKAPPKPTGLEALREPFPKGMVSKLPKGTKAQNECEPREKISCPVCGGWHHPKVIHLDYVGHAAVTQRLLDAHSHWSWEPLRYDESGLPKLDQFGGMWIKLTVAGMTRMGYGDAGGKQGSNAIKEVIGDALRNAAMRFGVALELWHKGDWEIDTIPSPTDEVLIQPEDVLAIEEMIKESGSDRAAFLRFMNVTDVSEIKAALLSMAVKALEKKIAIKKAEEKPA